MDKNVTVNIIYLCFVTILPIIPAFILYKNLPSKGVVKGIFKGLDIKLGGAFGGYFVVFLALLGFIINQNVTQVNGDKSDGHEYEMWNVEGKVELPDSLAPISDMALVKFLIKPPNQVISEDGRFIIENVPIPKDRSKTPSLLLIKLDPKQQVKIVHLDKEKKEYETKSEYEINYLDSGNSKAISIVTPIELEMSNYAGITSEEYSAEGAAQPVPID